MLDISIANGRGRRNKASVSEDGFLRVDTKPYYEYKNSVRYFVSQEYGRNMNVDASPSASTTENIYNGGDDTYWTPSVIAGADSDFEFESTDQSYTGSKSFRYNAENNEVAQFAKGSDLDLTNYNSLIGWIYITDWDTTNQQIQFYGYNLTTGTIIGNVVNVGDYINTGDQNTWQSFNITLNDMGLVNETIDSLRTEVVDTGQGGPPRAYLDDLRFTGNSTNNISPVNYKLEPNISEYLIVESLNFTFVREYDSSISNGTMYGLSYDDILGLTISNGILYRIFSEQVLEFNILLKNLFDLLSIPDLTITDACYDGTNTILKLKYSFVEQAVLRYSKRDYIELRLLDDFSSFKEFRVSAGCKIIDEEYHI